MKPLHKPLSRRQALALLGAASIVVSRPARADALPEVTVHKDPSCGCCGAWAEHLRRSSFSVKIVETANVMSVKQRLGVPADLTSCHTAEVGGYVVEGHVPAAAIKLLLADKPSATGLAVAGMPGGSPGMEGSGPDPYEVVLFGPQGRQIFKRYLGDREL